MCVFFLELLDGGTWVARQAACMVEQAVTQGGVARACPAERMSGGAASNQQQGRTGERSAGWPLQQGRRRMVLGFDPIAVVCMNCKH